MPLKVDQVITNSLSVNGVDVNKNTKHYELDWDATNTVTVDSTFGIIDIINIGASAPSSAFTSDITFYINNLELDLTVIDNIYVQFSVYYSQTTSDNAIPYLISTGASPTGLEFKLYNANPAAEDTNNFEGLLYVYFELYTIN